ncbi:MAG: AAA family ATPase, partial [Planctomycetota bacterium]
MRVVVPRIRRVHIENYKSIARGTTDLGPFTALVGTNGSGKSNFIDALMFVQESLSGSLELAFKNRGGIGAVRRISGGHPTHIGIRIVLDLEDDIAADYAFRIAAKSTERFRIAQERCVVRRLMSGGTSFEIIDGTFAQAIPGIRPQVAPDRLGLFAASATEEFRPVYDFLTAMRFYSIVPSSLRELQDPDPGDSLKRDGSNAGAVLKRISEAENGAERYERFCRLLSRIV